MKALTRISVLKKEEPLKETHLFEFIEWVRLDSLWGGINGIFRI